MIFQKQLNGSSYNYEQELKLVYDYVSPNWYTWQVSLTWPKRHHDLL